MRCHTDKGTDMRTFVHSDSERGNARPPPERDSQVRTKQQRDTNSDVEQQERTKTNSRPLIQTTKTERVRQTDRESDTQTQINQYP